MLVTPANPRFGGSLARFLLLLILCSATLLVGAVDVTGGGGGSDTIQILNLLVSKDFFFQHLANEVKLGIKAALHNVSGRAADGRTIELVYPEDSDTGLNVTYTIATALKRYPGLLAILGPLGDKNTVNALNSSIVKDNNLVCLSPLTGSRLMRHWSKNAFFMRADPHTELVALLNYVILELEVKRVGFMYLTGVGYGEDEFNATRTLLKRAGILNDLIVYVQPEKSRFNMTVFREFADQRPQAILFFGKPGMHSKNFVEACLLSQNTSGAVLLGPFVMQSFFGHIYSSISKYHKITPRDGHLVTSGTSLLPTDTQYEHIRVFREQVTAYHAATGKGVNFSDVNNSVDRRRYEEDGSLVTGWVVGTVMARLLWCSGCTLSREAFQRHIFTQSRFVIYKDLVLGDYGGECTPLAREQGVLCECNQGARAAYIQKYLANGTVRGMHDARYFYPMSVCYASSIEFKTFLNIMSLRVTDQHIFSKTTESFLAVKRASKKRSLRDLLKQYGLNLRELNVTESTVPLNVHNHAMDFRVHLFTGPTTTSMPKSFVMINPVFKRPRLNVYSHNNIAEVMPTLEQQFFVVMRYLSDKDVAHKVASTDLTAVVRGLTPKESRAMLDVLDRTAITFGVALVGKRGVGDGDELTRGIALSGYTLLVGLDREDVQRVAALLRANPAACVVVSYQDFSLHYDVFMSVFRGESSNVQGRLLTTTNLPHWTDSSSEAHKDSLLLKAFHSYFEEEYRTPSTFESFIVVGMSLKLFSLGYGPDKLLEALYTNNIFSIYGKHFGPYYNSRNRTYEDVDASSTVKNYGARDIYMLSMERVFNSSVANDYPHSTPDMVYTIAGGARESTGGKSIAGIVIGCAVAFVVFALCLVWFLSRSLRSNRNAPKDAQRPVTLIFTDIESSTALWGTLPQLMPNVVATHHRLIRGVIARHGCYEVKTVGDSFMIACREAHTAVQVACEIQQVLFRNDWGTCELDRVYREFEMRRRDENLDYKVPTALLPCDEYGALWNGLRVRVGIHTGLSDIRYDVVTKGFDYYGDTSNIAARTEAIGNGGQVLLTEWTWWSLSHVERASLRCTSLGSQSLRDVKYPVEVYQLNSFPGRRYAELRTAMEATLPNADNMSDASPNASRSGLLSLSESAHSSAATVVAVLKSCFSSFSAAERVKGLLPLLLKWNIAIPQLSRGTTEEDYCRDLINRLAVKMAMMAQLQLRLGDIGGVGNPFRTLAGAARKTDGGGGVALGVGDATAGCHAPGRVGSGVSLGSSSWCGSSVEITLPPDLAARSGS